LPLYGHAIPSLEDARQRLLATGGTMIPQRDTLKAALIEAEGYYSNLTSPWRKSVPELDLTTSVYPILNESYGSSFKKEQLLTEAKDWGVLDYTVGAAARASAELDFQVTREGMAHGVCLWFETELFENIGFSSGPGSANSVYGQAFLPWLEPVAVETGQRVHLGLHADLVGQEYVWRWETRIPAGAGHPAVQFEQSTFQGANFSPQSFRRQTADYSPRLSEAGQATLWMLRRMDGSTSLQEIAQSASARFPRLFSSRNEAFLVAAELSKELSS